MRIWFVAAILACSIVTEQANSASFTESGSDSAGGIAVFDAFYLPFTFAPVDPATLGTVTSISLDYTGMVFPGVHVSGMGIDTLTLAPSVGVYPPTVIGTSGSLGFTAGSLTVGTPLVVPFDDSTGLAMSSIGETLSAHADAPVTAANLAGLAAGPVIADAVLSSSLTGYTGTGFLDTSNFDNGTSGTGTMTLTISYDPIPEPASITLVGLGLLALAQSRSRGLRSRPAGKPQSLPGQHPALVTNES